MFVARMLPGDRDALDAIARVTGSDVTFEHELARTWSRIWVARLEPGAQDPIGFSLAWAVADELHLINLAVHPDWRRQGAASALLQTLIEHASTERVRLVLLEVRRSNRAAIHLYRAHGFTAMGVRRRYYADNAEDAIEMMLALDPATGSVLRGRDEIQSFEA
ncbi:MAG TPA: ribosomal protein S18-alanine N-acetyltransferase [Polyangiales bacterium]|nr:ribosomal protein S18-alanine N-acetyltransferase [Polyangiales bacterium]